MDVLTSLKADYCEHYPLEAAKNLNLYSTQALRDLVAQMPLERVSKAFSLLHQDKLAALLGTLAVVDAHRLLNMLPSEVVAKTLHYLGTEKKAESLRALSKEKRKDVEEILKYPPQTAGAMMNPAFLVFTPSMTTKEAVDKIKAHNRRGMRVLFLVDEDRRLVSWLSIQDLVMADESTLLGALAKPVPSFVLDLAPQEEIVERLAEHNMTDLPVVDLDNHLVGIVSHHKIVKATEEELTKDIQTMVGVSQDERALSKVSFAVRKRLPWLEVNLLTAFLAAAVVGLFEGTIAKYTALAVLLPVVAGQSGNTGAQALAVTMRGLALKEVRISHWFRLMFKECKIACFTGVAVAIPTALGVFLWSKSLGLMFIIFISMIVSMIIAGISGAAVPLVLVKLNQDPASASSIILTTVTDVCGFFSFLGIATALSGLI